MLHHFQPPKGSVSHHFLIAKLSQLNINDFLLIDKWIIDYLTDRSQCVAVIGATSPPLQVLSGVPHGSVHAPLLFIIYIGCLTDVMSNTSMSLYADNLLYWPINSSSDYLALQAKKL